MIPVKQTVSNKSKKLIIRLKDVERIYKVGVESIHALGGINLELYENEYVAWTERRQGLMNWTERTQRK